MTVTKISENMYLALSVIIVGALSIGWVGSRAVDYTFSDVRQNTEFRVKTTQETLEMKKDIADNAIKLQEISDMKEMLGRIDERLKRWEPTD